MKLFNSKFSLIALAGALTFAGCEDVPAPYEINLETTPSDVLLSETFSTSLGDFQTVQSVGDYAWINSYSCAQVTAYVNSTNNDAESWLITPAIDAAGVEEAYVSFDYILRYALTSTMKENHQVLVSNNFTGVASDVNNANWTPLSFSPVSGSDWNTWYASGKLAIPAEFLNTTNLRIALRYKATTEKAGTWEVKNFIVSQGTGDSGEDNPVNPDQPLDENTYISESFESSFGTFTAVTVKGTPWVIDYSTAKATGYDNSTKTTTASDAYLVSKAIDLSGTDAANVAYQYILRYATNNGQPKDGVKNELLISDNYTGDPATTTWTDITPAMTEGKDWNTWFDAKVNVPAAMLKASIVVALHYTCADNSATWEVKNFKVSKGIAGEQGGEQGGTDTPSVEPTGDNLVGNGDFETWADGLPANWKTASTAGNANLSQSSDAHSGSYSVNVEGVTSANRRLGYQEITLKAGTYNIRFYAKAATATGGSVRPGYVPVKADGTAGSYLYGDYVNGLTTETWVECIHSFTLTEETKISLVVMCSKTPGGNVLIDDYSLTTSDGGLVK